MFARGLNMPLDYLSSFAVVLRGIHWKIGICQTDYNIHSKLRIFPYSEVIHGSTTKGKQRLKKNDQLINLMLFPFFIFLCSMFQTMSQTSVINRSGTCYFYLLFLVVHVLVCAHAITLIKRRRLGKNLSKTKQEHPT